MAQFYITSDPPDDHIRKCRESLASGERITIVGQADGEDLKGFVGVVQNLEDFGASAPRSRRWRVTILD